MMHAQLIKLKRTPFVWYLIISTIGILAEPAIPKISWAMDF